MLKCLKINNFKPFHVNFLGFEIFIKSDRPSRNLSEKDECVSRGCLSGDAAAVELPEIGCFQARFPQGYSFVVVVEVEARPRRIAA